MKKKDSKKKGFFDYFMYFMFISIFVPFIIGVIVLMIDDYRGVLDSNNRALYILLSSFAFMYIDFCIAVLHEVFTHSKKLFIITILISAILIGTGLFFRLRINDERSEVCPVLEVNASNITIKFQDIELNIKKPLLKKAAVGNNIKVYYSDNNIDKIHFISYTTIGNLGIIYGCIFLLFGGMFMVFIPEIINSYKSIKKKERKNI